MKTKLMSIILGGILPFQSPAQEIKPEVVNNEPTAHTQDLREETQVQPDDTRLEQQKAYNEALKDEMNREIQLNTQLQAQIKQQQKLEKELKKRADKQRKLEKRRQKLYENEAKLRGELAAIQLQPQSSEQMKREAKLTKQLNQQIAAREKTERDLNIERNSEQIARQNAYQYQPDTQISQNNTISQQTSVDQSLIPPTPTSTVQQKNDNYIQNNAPVSIQPTTQPVSQPVIQPDHLNALKQVRETLTPDDEKGLHISGNLIVGNNNVIIVVDDKDKAGEVIEAFQKGYKQPDYQPNSAAASKQIPSTRYMDDDSFYEPVKKRYYRDDNTGKIKKIFTESLFDHTSLGIKASTMGIGVELATTLSRNLQFRAGYNYADFNRTIKFKTNDEALDLAVGAQISPKLKSDVDFRYNNWHALIDLYPLRGKIFHFTAGVYYGDSKINVDGQIVDKQTSAPLQLAEGVEKWPDLYFADYKIPVNNGNVKADVELGNKWKPYFGIGLGRTVSKSPVSLKLEIGALYQGKYAIKQNGVELAKDKTHADSFVNEKDYTRWLKFYPVVNLQVSIRLW